MTDDVAAPWREEGPYAWSLRLIPNPLGLELYLEGGSAGDWIWHIFATTSSGVAEVTCGDAESLDAAKGRAEAKARELLSALRSRVAELEEERESRRRVGRPPRRATSADGRLVARARAMLAITNTQLAARIGYHPSVLSHATLSAAVRAAVIAAIDSGQQKHS
jgi:hypothetical protein